MRIAYYIHEDAQDSEYEMTQIFDLELNGTASDIFGEKNTKPVIEIQYPKGMSNYAYRVENLHGLPLLAVEESDSGLLYVSTLLTFSLAMERFKETVITFESTQPWHSWYGERHGRDN